MAMILIVDDEAPLLRNLASYLASFDDALGVLTAASGEEAIVALESQPAVELLLTDVRLPGMDGIELIRQATELVPGLRVIVMTAFPSRDIRRTATAAGAVRYLEKPLDLPELRTIVLGVLDEQRGWSGSVGGLDIFDLTQLFAMSRKSTAIAVRCADCSGRLVFRNGRLIHASSCHLQGEKAFRDMASWAGGSFVELPIDQARRLATNVTTSTNHLLIEVARLRDEETRDTDSLEPDPGGAEIAPAGIVNQQPKGERDMAVKDHLAEFEGIEGFQGAAVFTAQGEMLEGVAKGKLDIKTVGMFANNALLNAQKATDQMGVGRGNLMTIRAPSATVLMRCLNEATDFAATKEGKAHFHTVVVMDPEGNTGMASMILDKVVGRVAEEVR